MLLLYCQTKKRKRIKCSVCDMAFTVVNVFSFKKEHIYSNVTLQELLLSFPSQYDGYRNYGTLTMILCLQCYIVVYSI